MAEYIPPPKTVFSLKIVNGQFVVENNTGNTVTEDINEQYHAYLNNFRSILRFVNENDYDKDVISQLLLSNIRLSLCLPNRRIKELELSLAPLLHHQATIEFILGADTSEIDEPSQHTANYASGKSWDSLISVRLAMCHDANHAVVGSLETIILGHYSTHS